MTPLTQLPAPLGTLSRWRANQSLLLLFSYMEGFRSSRKNDQQETYSWPKPVWGYWDYRCFSLETKVLCLRTVFPTSNTHQIYSQSQRYFSDSCMVLFLVVHVMHCSKIGIWLDHMDCRLCFQNNAQGSDLVSFCLMVKYACLS